MYYTRQQVLDFFNISPTLLKRWEKAGILCPPNPYVPDLFLVADVRKLLTGRSYDLLAHTLLRAWQAAKHSGVGTHLLRDWVDDGLDITIQLPLLPGQKRAARRYVLCELDVVTAMPLIQGQHDIVTVSELAGVPWETMWKWVNDGSLPYQVDGSTATPLLGSTEVRKRLLKQFRDEQAKKCN